MIALSCALRMSSANTASRSSRGRASQSDGEGRLRREKRAVHSDSMLQRVAACSLREAPEQSAPCRSQFSAITRALDDEQFLMPIELGFER